MIPTSSHLHLDNQPPGCKAGVDQNHPTLSQLCRLCMRCACAGKKETRDAAIKIVKDARLAEKLNSYKQVLAAKVLTDVQRKAKLAQREKEVRTELKDERLFKTRMRTARYDEIKAILTKR